MAKVKISYQVGGRFDGGGPVQQIVFELELVYNYLSDNTWKNPSGSYWGSGTWGWTGYSVSLYKDGNLYASLDDVPGKTVFGNPLSGQKGAKGIGVMYNTIVGMKRFRWEITDA